MLGLMKFKKLFWKKSDEHDKLDELDHEFIAGFTKREIIRMIQNMSDEELDKASAEIRKIKGGMNHVVDIGDNYYCCSGHGI